MHKAILAAFAGALILALLITGCGGSEAGSGGDGGDTASAATTSLTKTELIAQGDAICKKHGEQDNAKFEAYAKEHKIPPGGKASKAQQEELIEEVILPSISAQAEEIGGLDASSDGDKVDAIVAGLEEAVEEAGEDPALVFDGSGPLARVKKLAEEYGFKICG